MIKFKNALEIISIKLPVSNKLLFIFDMAKN